MPVKVFLQDVKGKKIDQVIDRYADLDRLWPVGDKSFPLLQYIEPYGSTIFNTRQMEQVLLELDLMASRTTGGEDSALLGRIRALAVQCRDHPHLYLRFLGD